MLNYAIVVPGQLSGPRVLVRQKHICHIGIQEDLGIFLEGLLTVSGIDVKMQKMSSFWGKDMKKMLSLLLVFSMAVSLAIPAGAAEDATDATIW